ncbi:MAG: NAD(+)/NADH kinase [Acidimicrobiia bacterium]
MRFSLEVRQGSADVMEFGRRLGGVIEAAGGEVAGEDGPAPDLVIAVGGDGTMLAATQKALRHDVPILGFNLGTLGFLAEAEPEEMETVVERLLSGDFDVAERMTLRAAIGDRTATGVNDVIVEKVDSQRLIHLKVAIDGIPFITYRADGLIAATATGSTAYSFSAGGPLLSPDLEAVLLTPVAAHSLFDRTLVLPPDTTLDVTVSRDRPVKVTVDKEDMGHLGEGATVSITRGDRPAKFVDFGRRFAELVGQKFGLS